MACLLSNIGIAALMVRAFIIYRNAFEVRVVRAVSERMFFAPTVGTLGGGPYAKEAAVVRAVV